MRGLNTEKMMRMALLHELQEIIVGDLTPEEKNKISEEELKQREIAAIRQILSHLPHKLQKKYTDLWKEMESGKSKESKLIKELDKLELVFQASEYEREGYSKEKLNEFYEFSKERLKDPELIKIFELLKKENKRID
jgi:putative hydrolase of HD superfamily